jgi:hypothetical protein
MIATIKANWFWPIAMILTMLAWSTAQMSPSTDLAGWELAVLFDVLVTLPLLFLVYYRKKLGRSALIVRILALQCLGIWLATKLVPAEGQVLLPQLAWLRHAGLCVLVVIELRVMIALFQMIFKPGTTEQNLEAIGMPPLLAKLALMEARFWRWVFGIFKR